LPATPRIPSAGRDGVPPSGGKPIFGLFFPTMTTQRLLNLNRIFLHTEGAPLAFHLIAGGQSHFETVCMTFSTLDASNQSRKIKIVLFGSPLVDTIRCIDEFLVAFFPGTLVL
jgi:hypothetical protein